MAKKFLWLILFFAILVILALGLGILGRSGDWVCEDGQWIKIGNPRQPAPEQICQNLPSLSPEKEASSAVKFKGSPLPGFGFQNSQQEFLLTVGFEEASVSATASPTKR